MSAVKLIAFAGLAGAGKTTAALHLVNEHRFVRTRFADPLKAMLRAVGLGEAEVDGDLKERPTPLLCGRTPRWAMQTLGTEWGRNCISADLWTTLWAARAADCLDLGGRVVVDDCRFGNEVDVVQGLGGIVVRIHGRSAAVGGHASEQQDLKADFEIVNDGDVSALAAAVDAILAEQSRNGLGTFSGLSAA